MAITNVPNENQWKTDRRNGSFPLTESVSPCRPPNEGEWKTGHSNGSFPLGQMASPINPPNAGEKWDATKAAAEHAKMNTPAAVEPGKSAVPVSPGVAGYGGGMAPAELRQK
jgi:hypothetical protein